MSEKITEVDLTEISNGTVKFLGSTFYVIDPKKMSKRANTKNTAKKREKASLNEQK